MRALAALLASFPLVAAWPSTAGAQVHRCNAPDGTSIFTDRACASLGATASLPDAGSHRASHASRMRCMGSVQDLMFEMSMAFDAGDANRLASVYHWAGMSSGSAYATIERLDRMVSRPLVDIVPMMPTPPQPPPAPQPLPRPSAASDAATSARSPETAEEDESYVETLARRYADSPAPEPEPEPAVHHDAAVAASGRPTPPPTTLPPAPVVPVAAARPVGIKVVQTLTDGVTPTSTVFGLTRHFGCWWIRN